LKARLEAAPDVAILFGAEISGAAIAKLVAFVPICPVRCATWRSATTPIRRALPTWACCQIVCRATPTWTNAGAREALEKLWGGVIPSKAGQTAPQMIDAAQAGKLKALYVVGANPFMHFGTAAWAAANWNC